MSRRGSGGVGATREGPPTALPPEFELVLIDGDNLLHRIRGMRDDAGLRWLLPRLRAWLPRGTRALVMLDGHPDPGDSYRRHAATGVDFQHSGNVDADTALVGTLRARPYAERARTVVVSDDRALGDRVRHDGGLVRRLDWLVGGLAAAVGDVGSAGTVPRPLPSAESSQGMVTAGIRPVGIGGGSRSRSGTSRARGTDTAIDHPAAGTASGSGGGESHDRAPWKPGRGATRKRGNPKREPKASP